MSLPDNVLSTVGVPSVMLTPDSQTMARLEDFEKGGVAIGDASEGLNAYRWRCYMDGSTVTLQRDGTDPVALFIQGDIVELSFAFDQNMRPHVAYQLGDGSIRLRWFDSILNAYVTTNFGNGRNPRLSLDDKRPKQALNSDIIFAYISGSALRYRQQRDRFGVERTLATGIGAASSLLNVGMSRNLRLLFSLA